LILNPAPNVATEPPLQGLVERTGLEHVERRLKIETEHQAQLFGQGLIGYTSVPAGDNSAYLARWAAAIWFKVMK
jgi:hypothetical protein